MQQLSGLDASFVYSESAHAPTHVTSILIYDQSTAPKGEVTFKGILEHIEQRLHLAHAFRRRLVRVPFDLKRVLHGEQEYEFLKPIHAGDVLTAVSRIVDIYEKPGKRGGSMNFAVTETEYKNERGELVARARHITIETGQVVKD